jgi:hypothetical protein
VPTAIDARWALAACARPRLRAGRGPLASQVQQGLVAGAAKSACFLAPLTGGHVLGPELHSNVAVVRLLQGFSA